jgi:hypothetical protein
MIRASAAISLAATALGLATLGGADAAVDRGTTPHFRGPVAVSGLCSARAAYRAVVRQDGNDVVMTAYVRRAGERVRWNLSTQATTYFGDGTAVTGIGDFGSTRTDRDGRATVQVATPVGARHDLRLDLWRAKTEEHCLIRITA